MVPERYYNEGGQYRMLWWERLLEIGAGLLAMAIPASFGFFRNLKPPVFDQDAPTMVIRSVVYMQNKRGQWWAMTPTNMKMQNFDKEVA